MTTYRHKARGTPGGYQLKSGTLALLIDVADVIFGIDRGDGATGTLVGIVDHAGQLYETGILDDTSYWHNAGIVENDGTYHSSGVVDGGASYHSYGIVDSGGSYYESGILAGMTYYSSGIIDGVGTHHDFGILDVYSAWYATGILEGVGVPNPIYHETGAIDGSTAWHSLDYVTEAAGGLYHEADVTEVQSSVTFGASEALTGTYDPMADAVWPAELNVSTVETAWGPTGVEYAGSLDLGSSEFATKTHIITVE